MLRYKKGPTYKPFAFKFIGPKGAMTAWNKSCLFYCMLQLQDEKQNLLGATVCVNFFLLEIKRTKQKNQPKFVNHFDVMFPTILIQVVNKTE